MHAQFASVRGLLELNVRNYLSLHDVSVKLGRLNVLVGANGSGKSNLLDVIRFLGDSVRGDLGPALDDRGGFERLQFRGRNTGRIEIGLKAEVTRYATKSAPDEYVLSLTAPRAGSKGGARPPLPQRSETFTFKRTSGRGRRITVRGESVTDRTDGGAERKLNLERDSLGLSVLSRVTTGQDGNEVRKIAELFSQFRVFDVNVTAARAPSAEVTSPTLRADAGNLSAFLHYLHLDHSERFEQLQEDARAIVPGFKHLHFRRFGGAREGVAAEFEETGLKGRTHLGEASFGTIRGLALLALLYDPAPPKLTCIEEIDHGLHPYVFDRLVERLRDASTRSQFIIATHSPSLVNRLKPQELIVCERDDETGASRIPAIDSEIVSAMQGAAPSLQLGELWFTGSLGGVPQ